MSSIPHTMLSRRRITWQAYS